GRCPYLIKGDIDLMDGELTRVCMNCQSYYPDRLDEATEFGICLNDSDFEP
ncbi:unnamed protein product, partial [marine sediment metagenome]